MIIFVTGRLGSGKSTVCRFLEKKGCRIIDADRIGHEVLKRPQIRQSILQEFGNEILSDSNAIMRATLATVVFSSEDNVKKINLITHPEIKKEIERRISPNGCYVIDAALYDELKPRKKHIVILVKANNSTIKKRIKNKALLRRRAYQKEAVKADFVINNDGTITDLKIKVEKVWQRLTKRYCFCSKTVWIPRRF